MKKVRADAIWNHGPELIDDDGEVRELMAADFKRMTPFAELPQEMREMLLSIKTATFVPDPEPVEEVTLKLSQPVLQRFRAQSTGWESRLDAALRQWCEEHKAS